MFADREVRLEEGKTPFQAPFHERFAGEAGRGRAGIGFDGTAAPTRAQGQAPEQHAHVADGLLARFVPAGRAVLALGEVAGDGFDPVRIDLGAGARPGARGLHDFGGHEPRA